jgi:serine/threonine protein kinase
MTCDLGRPAQVLVHIAERLRVLHAAGWAHRDLKPGNVLRRPTHHSWTLIDFGCTARIGPPPWLCLAFSACEGGPVAAFAR